MIAIDLDLSKSGLSHIDDTLRSLVNNASTRENYEVIIGDLPTEKYMPYIDRIFFVDEPPDKSRVCICIPGDAIVLANSWDKYFIYDLENNKVIDVWEVIKRMNLTGHRESTLSLEVSVRYKEDVNN